VDVVVVEVGAAVVDGTVGGAVVDVFAAVVDVAPFVDVVATFVDGGPLVVETGPAVVDVGAVVDIVDVVGVVLEVVVADQVTVVVVLHGVVDVDGAHGMVEVDGDPLQPAQRGFAAQYPLVDWSQVESCGWGREVVASACATPSVANPKASTAMPTTVETSP
jgi:hypothetical protein